MTSRMALLPLLILIILTHLSTSVLASDSRDLCSWDNLLTSSGKSFTPWFRGWTNVTSGPGGSDPDFVNNMACWWYADCIFSLVPDTRKQQYSAISIVMALVPLMLKDIAWPPRRIVLLSKTRHWAIEILVRALGLNPVLRRDQTEMKEGRTFSALVSMMILVLLAVCLLLAYGMLVIMELFSKGSALGCSMPAFVALWFVFALAPAAIEVAFRRFRCRKKQSPAITLEHLEPQLNRASNGGRESKYDSINVVSESGQGGKQHWMAQFCWGLYYSAGGLVFTSIMLVSVVELFTWMLLAGVTSATGKLLGYKLCGYWGTRFE